MNDPRYYDKMNGGQNDKNEHRPALDRAPQIFKVDCIFVLPFVRHLKKKTHGEEEEDGMMKMVKMEGDERDILLGYWERFILLVTS